MFKTEFICKRFSGSLAHSVETYAVPQGVEVREIDYIDYSRGNLVEDETVYEAVSEKPFSVVITTEAGGEDSHLDGMVRVVI